MIHYVCKYTPVELFKGFGEDCAVLECIIGNAIKPVVRSFVR